MLESAYLLIFFIFGLAFGSFLGVLTYRLPRNLSILGRSACPHCRRQIRWRDNIPLLSYFLLSGRCRFCRQKISRREPAIEATTATAFLGIYLFYQNGSTVEMVVALVFIFILLAIFVVDLEKMLIPDSFLTAFAVLVAATVLALPSPLLFEHLFVGLLSFSFFLVLYLATRRRGIGFGDVKFSFLLGTFLGYPAALVAFFLAFLTGGATGAILILGRRAKMSRPVPFGPFLVAGSLISFFFAEQILQWYLP